MKGKDLERPPIGEDGRYDKVAVKALFDASPYIDWTRFCEANGWDAHYIRREFPVAQWQKEKKERIAERESEILMATLFERRFKWHKDVVKTLEDYPPAIDMAMFLLRAKMSDYAESYKEYQEAKKSGNLFYKNTRGQMIRKKFVFEDLSPMDMKMISSAVKDVTDAKHRSLLLNSWSVDQANRIAEPQSEDDPAQLNPPVFRLAGGDMKIEDIQKALDTWLDKPVEEVKDES